LQNERSYNKFGAEREDILSRGGMGRGAPQKTLFYFTRIFGMLKHSALPFLALIPLILFPEMVLS